jgi:PAP2 superfamily
MIRIFKKYKFSKYKNLILLAVLFIFTISFSSFNPIENKERIFSLKVKSIITQWYDLLLILESKDINAYPPISAERIAGMGFGGYVTYDELKHQFYNNDIQALHILNDVYAYQLHQYFSSISSTEKVKIHTLSNKIKHLLSGPSNAFDTQNEVYIHKIINRLNTMKEYSSGCSDDSITFVDKKTDKYQTFESENPVLPHWGAKRTWAVQKSTIKISSPYMSSSSFEKSLFDDALSVYTFSMNRTPEDQWIAEFWSDDVRGLTFSPAGRWISITNQIVRKEEISAPAMFELYFNLGVGLYDAGVLCWQSKYHYMLERPSSFINRNIEKNWKPLHDNPQFPAYPSGHAVFGAVSATILEHHFGKFYTFTDKSHQNRLEFRSSGRSFQSLNEMAVENAYSRFVMGVHFKQDCEAGLKLGYEVGSRIIKIHPDTVLNKKNLLPVF